MRSSKTLVVAAVAGLMLAGCGDDGGSSNDKTITVSSGKGGGADLFKAMSDAQADAGSFTVDLAMTAEMAGDEPIVEASGVAEIVDGSINQQLEMAVGAAMGAPMDMEVIFLDGMTYTNMFGAIFDADQAWVSVDPDDNDPFSKAFGEYMQEQAAMTESTEMFEKHADLLEVEEGGTDTIDDADVTEYLVTVDKQDFVKFGVADAEQLPIDEVAYSIWVDDDYLARRITFDLGDDTGGIKMEMSLADFGEDVTIEVPSEDVIPVRDFVDDMLESGDITEEQFTQLEEQFGNM